MSCYVFDLISTFSTKFWALCKTWNGMEWIGLDWIGLDWIGMEWNRMEWSSFFISKSVLEIIHLQTILMERQIGLM